MTECPNRKVKSNGSMKCALLPKFSGIAGLGQPNNPCPQCWFESAGNPSSATPTIQKLLAIVQPGEVDRGDCRGCGK